MKKLFRTSQKLPLSDGTSVAANSATAVGLRPRFNVTIPPVPHPTPYYRIAVLATPNALLLRPIIPGVSVPHSYVRVAWGSSFEMEELSTPTDDSVLWNEAAVVFGVLGCLKLVTNAYILVITAKSDVGHFLDDRNGVYGIRSVAAIPLQESRARAVLNTLSNKYNHINSFSEDATQSPDLAASDPSDLGHVHEDKAQSNAQSSRMKFTDTRDVKFMSPLPDTEFPSPSPASSVTSGTSTPTSNTSETSVAKVLANRLSFWDRLSQQRTVEHSSRQLKDGTLDDSGREPERVLQDILETTSSAPTTVEERQSELDQKILRQCIKEFTKGVMFFAYNFDITTSIQHKQDEIARLRRKTGSQSKSLTASLPNSAAAECSDVLEEPHSTLPLWRRVTKQFWWNEHMLQPFIDANTGQLHCYILPVMQGFYQISSFGVPREPESLESGDSAVVDYIVISRRSRERAGLRYQRRGVDDDANVANFVETESVTRVEREGRINVFSYIQIRGSIPLFWTQSGYSLKPPPVLSPERTHDQNLGALRRHFSKTISRYGPHTIVNLAEQQGKEAAITRAYRECVGELHSKDVRYTEYDFHKETKGMHYENISSLVKRLSNVFETQGFTWFSGEVLMSKQRSVFRVNCIDCLDRTNVVQSAFARRVLEKQLGALALLVPPGLSDIDITFNDIWANNGDALSRAYAGTSALKGDYTRTGKRDLTGMLNDGMNSLARMYSSTFSDWFSQAVIDFVLGNRTLTVFSEFLEKLQSTDPRERIRTEAIRTEAIADSVSCVLSEGEPLLSGWTLLSPAELGVKFSDKLQEKILLLSVQAVYVISYDYTLEKVASYTRILLNQITRITKGEYILSPLEEGSRDPLQNYGFSIHYLTSGETTRFSSYSLRNSVENVGESSPPDTVAPGRPNYVRSRSSVFSRMINNAASEKSAMTSFAAFKALPIDPVRSRRTTGSFVETANDLTWARTCKEATDVMVDRICQAIVAIKDTESRDESFLVLEPIVSLEEAQRATTMMAKMEYGIKRLLWLGS
ncbi:hypothetical protein ACEPAH_4711 [Sanghuangporus vaninii]